MADYKARCYACGVTSLVTPPQLLWHSQEIICECPVVCRAITVIFWSWQAGRWFHVLKRTDLDMVYSPDIDFSAAKLIAEDDVGPFAFAGMFAAYSARGCVRVSFIV